MTTIIYLTNGEVVRVAETPETVRRRWEGGKNSNVALALTLKSDVTRTVFIPCASISMWIALPSSDSERA